MFFPLTVEKNVVTVFLAFEVLLSPGTPGFFGLQVSDSELLPFFQLPDVGPRMLFAKVNILPLYN